MMQVIQYMLFILKFEIYWSQLYFKYPMGGSSDRIKVAIIDENDDRSQFLSLINDDALKVTYYKTWQDFLEKQSLKKLSYIVIREKQNEELSKDVGENSVMNKTIRNKEQLNAIFNKNDSKNYVTVRERLIAYIQKFSLEKLVIYLYIKSIHDFKIPDYEAPYITLMADRMEAIIEHLKTIPKREEPSIFKFKRLVKDLYRRVTVRILLDQNIDEKVTQKYGKQWKSLMKKASISCEVSKSVADFEKSLVSNYNDYIIVNTPSMLTYILDAKKSFQIDSKIIYFGLRSEVRHKQSDIWYISDGSEQSYKETILRIIKSCSDIIIKQTSEQPKSTIIFTYNHYSQSEKLMIRNKTIEFLKIKYPNDQKWIDSMKILVSSNKDQTRRHIYKFVYTYILTFDSNTEQCEDLKAWLKKNNCGSRVYIYNYQPDKPKQPKQVVQNKLEKKVSSKAGDKKSEQEDRTAKITRLINQLVKSAQFQIKFEIGPLESIALFDLEENDRRYFSNKLGLITTMINEQQWKMSYCKQNREKIIEDYYIVCKVSDYFNKLKPLIDSEIDDNNSYFKDLKIIIYDKLGEIHHKWKELCQIPSIAFMHSNLSKIQSFLDIVFVPSLRISIFIKKSLPNYLVAARNLEESKCRALNLKGIIVSKNDLLKQVLSQDVVNSSEFELNFKHYSITNRNLEQSLESLYDYIAKFANLWRLGYNIVMKQREERQQAFETLKDDLRACLYKCKSYSLLDITDEEFDYFYIKRLDLCQTFLDLQIATIYMITLPHGFNKILQQIFSKPKQSCMIPKIFASLIVILLTAFCSVEDEVMSNQSLVVYIDSQDIATRLNSLNIGDILFNTSFIPSGKNQSEEQNVNNHCIFLQFDNIPMLSETSIKNYLYIERFSFYKESSEYLVAPYTHFVLKKKQLTKAGKYHIHLHAVNDQKKGFPQQVYEANSIDDKLLFSNIKDDVQKMNNNNLVSTMTKDVKSLYKRAQILGLYEEKREMINSIIDNVEYKNFMNAINNDRNLSALNHLKRKQKQQKRTAEIQAAHYKQMLAVEKSLAFFKLNQFDISIKELEKVYKYLHPDQDKDKQQDESKNKNAWILKHVIHFKDSMNNLSTKRHKLFNRCPKVKKWKIQAELEANNEQQTSFSPVAVMKEEQYHWQADYLPKRQQFYLKNEEESENVLLAYKILQNYGEHVLSFTDDMVYEKKALAKLKIEQLKLEKCIKYIVDYESFLLNNTSNRSEILKIHRSHSKSPEKHRQKSPNQFNPQRSVHLEPISPQKIKVNNSKIHILPQKTEIIFEGFAKQQLEQSKQLSRLSPIKNSTEFEKLLGVTETIPWQAFYIGDKFVLTKKGKHIKGKMKNKIQ